MGLAHGGIAVFLAERGTVVHFCREANGLSLPMVLESSSRLPHRSHR